MNPINENQTTNAKKVLDDKYTIVNGTYYNNKTPKDLINVLEKVRKEEIRIIVDYGDIETKKSWGEIHDIMGYVGRSSGNIKIPLLIYNSRSLGGGSLLTDCILSVKTSKGKKLLYQLK